MTSQTIPGLSGSSAVSFVYVSDRSRSVAFYRDTLGLALRGSDAFGDSLELGGALLRLTAMPDRPAHPHPVFGLEVGDLDAAMRDLRARGVSFDVFEGMGQDENGAWSAPDGSARLAFFKDPDGNALILSQTKR